MISRSSEDVLVLHIRVRGLLCRRLWPIDWYFRGCAVDAVKSRVWRGVCVVPYYYHLK
jgi:hypothetical protein